MKQIEPYLEQIPCIEQAVEILNKYNLVYLCMQEQTGKTVVCVFTLKECIKQGKVLVITKKEPIKSWHKVIDNCDVGGLSFDITNFESVHKFQGQKYDCVVIDEAHNQISGFPKRSKRWEVIKQFTKNKPMIFMSATPASQGQHMMFNQLALSSYSVWSEYDRKYTVFKAPFKWYADYAEKTASDEFKTIRTKNALMKDYTAVQHDRIAKEVDHLLVRKTRKEMGIEHEPEDHVHYIELSDYTKNIHNAITRKKSVVLRRGDVIHHLICNNTMKLRMSLHMLEGGVLKVEDEYLIMKNKEKINYIKEQWGDNDKNVIMYFFIGEDTKLREEFKHARILQIDKHSEGINLSEYDNLIFYSLNYKTAKYIQARARQVSKKRETPINVHFLMVKNCISEAVYKTVVKNKCNYTDKLYVERLL